MTASTVPAATAPFSLQGESFTVAQLAIVARALNEGLFYQTEFAAFCNSAWRELHPAEARCVTVSEDGPWVMREALTDGAYAQQRRSLKDRLAALPRGAYARLRTDWNDEGVPRSSWVFLISLGGGRVHEPQTSHLRGLMPEFNEMYSSCVGYEIYEARQAEEERRRQARSLQLIAERGWRVGLKVTSLKIGSTTYASGTVESITDGGYVTLLLAKRGSKNRWRSTVVAQNVDLPNAKADQGMPLIVAAATGEAIYSAAA